LAGEREKKGAGTVVEERAGGGRGRQR